MSKILRSESERGTELIAYNLAREIKPGDIIALGGEMGAGKTAFVRGLARYLEPEARVSRPTFALVNKYGRITHFDMYRITGELDLLSTGFFDYLGGGDILVIEWFENISAFFDGQTVNINIAKLGAQTREIKFERIGKDK